jgi:hypothetical protein
MPDWKKIALYGGAAAGAYFIARAIMSGTQKEPGITGGTTTGGGGVILNDPPPSIGPWTDTEPPDPIHVGQRGDPELESLLQEMDDTFLSYGGINLDWIDAAEVTEMRKTEGYHAVPPREYWPRMAATLRYGFMPIRQVIGEPLYITSAYRPPDYNKVVSCTKEVDGECVKWSKGSRHQFFEALDMVAPSGMANTQALAAAQIWNEYGTMLRMGLGVYGSEGAASNIHIDTGSKQRRWKNAKYWTDQAAS